MSEFVSDKALDFLQRCEYLNNKTTDEVAGLYNLAKSLYPLNRFVDCQEGLNGQCRNTPHVMVQMCHKYRNPSFGCVHL